MSFRIITNTISPGLARMITASKNPKAILEAMGLALVSLTKRAFTDPTLRPSDWPARKGEASNPLLIRSTLLRRSIRIVHTTSTEVMVGTDRPYAAAHQFGTGPYTIRPKNKKALSWPGAAHPVKVVHHPGLPARPFFPFTAAGEMTAKAKTKIESAGRVALARLIKP
ncbi:MAG: phage virion morphogenesis protein [Kiritimatiellia bacterium]